MIADEESDIYHYRLYFRGVGYNRYFRARFADDTFSFIEFMAFLQ